MSDIKLYNSKIPLLIVLMLMILLLLGGAAWGHYFPDEVRMGQAVMVLSGMVILILLWKLFRRRNKITLTVHGIQFHYPTQRRDENQKKNIFNQFIAWDDIQIIQLKGRKLVLHIDDNPPDYERLTEIELANLPPRELVLYQLTANVAGLEVATQKIADWVNKMKQGSPKERNALILSFHYEK